MRVAGVASPAVAVLVLAMGVGREAAFSAPSGSEAESPRESSGSGADPRSSGGESAGSGEAPASAEDAGSKDAAESKERRLVGTARGGRPRSLFDAARRTSGENDPIPNDMKRTNPVDGTETDQVADENRAIATFGAGCFWCIEAVMERLAGVVDVVSGYMGGDVENPTYEEVCSKETGHAEVIQVTYDETKISFEDLLDVFWQAHDPTTLNRQGADVGPQYRSVIFYHSPEQKNIAEQSKAALDESGVYEDAAVTEIAEASTFWEAEDHHQDFYRRNEGRHPYCQMVISPKLEKFGLE